MATVALAAPLNNPHFAAGWFVALLGTTSPPSSLRCFALGCGGIAAWCTTKSGGACCSGPCQKSAARPGSRRKESASDPVLITTAAWLSSLARVLFSFLPPSLLLKTASPSPSIAVLPGC